MKTAHNARIDEWVSAGYMSGGMAAFCRGMVIVSRVESPHEDSPGDMNDAKKEFCDICEIAFAAYRDMPTVGDSACCRAFEYAAAQVGRDLYNELSDFALGAIEDILEDCGEDLDEESVESEIVAATELMPLWKALIRWHEDLRISVIPDAWRFDRTANDPNLFLIEVRDSHKLSAAKLAEYGRISDELITECMCALEVKEDLMHDGVCVDHSPVWAMLCRHYPKAFWQNYSKARHQHEVINHDRIEPGLLAA